MVVISNGQSPQALTDMNSVIRRIDLICKLCAPVFSGFIISFISLKASAMVLALWNILSVWLEYWLLTSVYNGIPALCESSERRHLKRGLTKPLEGCTSVLEENLDTTCEEGNLAIETSDWKKKIAGRLSKLPGCDAWIVYAKQDVLLPGIALALLYFTVLRSVSWQSLV